MFYKTKVSKRKRIGPLDLCIYFRPTLAIGRNRSCFAYVPCNRFIHHDCTRWINISFFRTRSPTVPAMRIIVPTSSIVPARAIRSVLLPVSVKKSDAISVYYEWKKCICWDLKSGYWNSITSWAMAIAVNAESPLIFFLHITTIFHIRYVIGFVSNFSFLTSLLKPAIVTFGILNPSPHES